jgi:hypothetical protein
MKKFQLEDDKNVIENSHISFEEAMIHAMRLKKRSHRNRPLKIYETTNGQYILKKAL